MRGRCGEKVNATRRGPPGALKILLKAVVTKK